VGTRGSTTTAVEDRLYALDRWTSFKNYKLPTKNYKHTPKNYKLPPKNYKHTMKAPEKNDKEAERQREIDRRKVKGRMWYTRNNPIFFSGNSHKKTNRK
jgi:hypothetical protein